MKINLSLTLAMIALSSAFSGCQSPNLSQVNQNTPTAQVAVTSENKDVTELDGKRLKTVKIEPIKSFIIEISPRVAVCDNPAMSNQCLQYRQVGERDYRALSRPIEGFEYQAGTRYKLDVRQVVDMATDGNANTRWILNRIVDSVVEKIGTTEPAPNRN